MKKTLKNFILSLLILSIFPLNIYAEENDLEIIQEIEEIIEEYPLPTDENGNVLTGQALKIHNIVENSNFYNFYEKIPTYTELTTENSNFISNIYTTSFSNGDIYQMNRINFKENKEERYEVTLKIKGENIIVRYVDPDTKEWVATGNLQNIKYATLFIDTDTNSYVVSVPAVYKNDFTNQTLTIVREEEITPVITKVGDGYELKLSFPQNPNYISEYWFLDANQPLVNWNLDTLNTLYRHDLSLERRWSYDGYYYPTPSTYNPSGENVLYRNPANYTGAYFIANADTNNLYKELGYVMTRVCMENQNSEGYWSTGPVSEWLQTDFGIGAYFYDTRFNTDFAMSLLDAYQFYNDKDFLKSAVTYAEYFIDYANNNHYKIEQGGILVQDYGWSGGEYEATHVSLNHHLAEMNFLYQLYFITTETSYLDLANEMLLGVENTKYRWVLTDNNLNYALYYTKDTNVMVDYPYLTYNDLYNTNALLRKVLNKSSDAIIYLMNCKREWMDKNNITEYNGYAG